MILLFRMILVDIIITLSLSFLFKWKGGGGLKRSENTSDDDAKFNMQLADDIVDNPTLSKWFGVFPIVNHGVFTINRSKAKMLLARKLSQEQKPSAYKRKVNIRYYSVPDKRGVSVQKPEKADFLTRQNEW